MMQENSIFAEQQPGLSGFDHLDGPWVPLATVTEWFGITERAVQLWVEKKYFKRDHRGMYHMPSVVRGVYEAQLSLINKKKGPEGLVINELELRKKRASTEKEELELEEMKGKLLNAEKVKKAAFEKARGVRDAIENIPNRLTSLLAAESDEFKLRELLTRELKSALENLSQDELKIGKTTNADAY